MTSETPCPELLAAFEAALLREQASPSTIRSYHRSVLDLLSFLEPGVRDDLTLLTGSELERWQDQVHQRLLQPSTRAGIAAAVRKFLRWAGERELLDWRLQRSVVAVQCARGKPRPIPPTDLKALKQLLAGRRSGSSVVELRDRALFYFFLETGARASEVLQVLRGDFEHAVVRQKGGADKILRIGPRVAEMITDYLSIRHDNMSDLWVKPGRGRTVLSLKYGDLQPIWDSLARKAGVGRWTTHQLRHTCASELLERGISALVAADHLGHRGTRTIAVYGQVRNNQRREALLAMEGLVTAKIRPDLLGKLSARGYAQ